MHFYTHSYLHKILFLKKVGVTDTDIISVFWSGTTCRTLVHVLGLYQPKTTKELLDIATWHASGEEAVGATFVLGNAKTAPAVAE
jgi:hypothetical protein